MMLSSDILSALYKSLLEISCNEHRLVDCDSQTLRNIQILNNSNMYIQLPVGVINIVNSIAFPNKPLLSEKTSNTYHIVVRVYIISSIVYSLSVVSSANLAFICSIRLAFAVGGKHTHSYSACLSLRGRGEFCQYLDVPPRPSYKTNLCDITSKFTLQNARPQCTFCQFIPL